MGSNTFSSDSLRGAATAALTAGATRGMTDRVWGTQTNSTTGATTNLNLSFGNGSDIARFAGQRATQAAIDAGIRTAIAGGSLGDHLGDSLENAVAHVVSGVLFNAVGDVSHGRFANASPEKIALHALVGGLTAEAMGGDFKTGALAAGANEALVEYLDSHLGSDPETRTHLLTTASQLVGIVAAELVNGDVNDGAFIAGQATRYNYLRHDQLAMARAELVGCDGDSDCMADVVARYQAISEEQNKAAIEACSTDLAACQEHSLAAADGEYARYGDDALWDLSNEALPYMQALFDENIGVQNSLGEATIARALEEGAGLSPEVAALLAAAPWGVNRKATTTGYFGGAKPRNIEEAQFLANAQATFENSSTWTGVVRHRDELVIQRSDIELSPQNATAMKNGYAPRVKNSNGEWEQVQLHHVGRETGKMIEVTKSQNTYSPTTGGPLHIPGPGAPVRQRDYTSTYWKERYQEFVRQGLIIE
ncbi:MULTISPECIES: DUF637 domain-containing protein [unclassified Halomonas]|nr:MULTISPECIES: DUF637 domain-containing protein [unclassified Halomonas]